MSASGTMRIGERQVGAGQPCFIIAEAGVNHDGDLGLARALIDAAVEAGADAVKFQTFRPERLCRPDAPKASYQHQGTPAGESQLDMLRRLALSEEAHRELQAHARRRGIAFLSTPFDLESVRLLDGLGVPALKLGSGDLTDLPLVEAVARTGRPLILSTGMSWLSEVEGALRAARAAGAREVALLHCVSAYPAPPAEANLRALETLRRAFGVPVGWSDHTPGLEVALAAVALGASIVEKHLTTDRGRSGPDHASSLDPPAFAALVAGVRAVESALGDGQKRPRAAEEEVRRVARKSLVAARALPAGATLDREALHSLRPGEGISPADLPRVLGRRLVRALAAGEPLCWDALAGEPSPRGAP